MRVWVLLILALCVGTQGFALVSEVYFDFNLGEADSVVDDLPSEIQEAAAAIIAAAKQDFEAATQGAGEGGNLDQILGGIVASQPKVAEAAAMHAVTTAHRPASKAACSQETQKRLKQERAAAARASTQSTPPMTVSPPVQQAPQSPAPQKTVPQAVEPVAKPPVVQQPVPAQPALKQPAPKVVKTKPVMPQQAPVKPIAVEPSATRPPKEPTSVQPVSRLGVACAMLGGSALLYAAIRAVLALSARHQLNKHRTPPTHVAAIRTIAYRTLLRAQQQKRALQTHACHAVLAAIPGGLLTLTGIALLLQS